MELSLIIPHIEALIFASDKPLSASELTGFVNNALGLIDDVSTEDQVDAAIEGIQEKYDALKNHAEVIYENKMIETVFISFLLK